MYIYYIVCIYIYIIYIFSIYIYIPVVFTIFHSLVCPGIMFPDKPDKKMASKVLLEKVQSFLGYMSTRPEVLSAPVFVDFLKPDEKWLSSGSSESVSSFIKCKTRWSGLCVNEGFSG